jgi:hypothetical protein
LEKIQREVAEIFLPFRLFNLLPPEVRSMSGCSVEMFKKAVDDFLSEVPDQPTVSGLTRAATTNSLIDQLAMQVGTTSF